MGNLCLPKSYTFWVANGYSETVLIRFTSKQINPIKLDRGEKYVFTLLNCVDSMLVEILTERDYQTLFGGFYDIGPNHIVTLEGKFVQARGKRIWIDVYGNDHQPSAQIPQIR